MRIPLFSSKAPSPVMIANEGSFGVDGVLCKKTRPSLTFMAWKSVNVPPTSTPINHITYISSIP